MKILIGILFLLCFQLFCYVCLESSSCYHDFVSSSDVPRSHVNYVSHKKRSIGSSYEPLKIYLHITENSQYLKEEEISILIIQKAIEDMSKLFSVTRAFNDALLLKRTACVSKWLFGKNRGRCARLRSNYKGEFCENKIDKFQIPSMFLEGLSVYNFTGNNSHFTIEAGNGASDSNYILFVTSVATNACLKNNIEAYGSHCQVDQFNRPIAGMINFCPEYLKVPLFQENHFYKVVIHEIFHVLGFSKSLFSKLYICSPGSSNCDVRKNAVVKDSSQIPRFTLPNVIKQMQLHFNCSDPEFGAPLERDMNGDYHSHWDPLLMYGSIMSPKLINPEYVFIDPITLAYFADTGWYKVNFSYSQNYIWGKGEGCNFGSNETCESSFYFCPVNQQNTVTGCDFLHYSKSTCESVVPYHSCGVFHPNTSNTCHDPDEEFAMSYSHVYNESTGCFMTKQEDRMLPECLKYNCSPNGHTYTVEMGNTSVTCSSSEMVDIETSQLLCPRHPTFCSPKNYTHESMFILNKDRVKCLFVADNFIIPLTMTIDMPTFDVLKDKIAIADLKASTLIALAENIKIPLNYMVNSTFNLFNKMQLDVSICMLKRHVSDEEISRVVKKVYKFNKQGKFSLTVAGLSPVAVVVSGVKTDVSQRMAFSDYEGVKIISYVPIGLAAFIIISFLTNIVRLFIMKQHRPHRKTEKQHKTERYKPSIANVWRFKVQK